MKKRNISLDLLKIILAVFIILLHCNFAQDYSDIINFLTVQGVFRISVPVFFIINGYYFKNVIDNKKLKNWIIRVSILYFLWMLIYLPLWFNFNIKSLFMTIIIGFHHLWYINAMIFCGISLFLIKNLKYKNLLIIALTLFLIGVIIQYLGNYHIFKNIVIDKLTNATFIYRNFIFLGLPFFITGYLIRVNNWEKRMTIKQITLLIILSSIFLFIESYFNYNNTKEGMDNLFSLILISPLIFIYSINIEINHNIDSKNIAFLSTAIYLIHPWVIKICQLYLIKNTLLLAVITILSSFIISIILIKINRKIKFLL